MKMKTLLLAGLVAAGMAQAEKPNVLFIAIDDLRNFVGCFGYDQVLTPNIDKLAEQSTVFLNAHNQAPMCGPSRSSLMNGIQPYNSGAYGFVDWRKVPMLNGATPLNKHFKNNGYHTMSGGKIYHGNTLRDGDWDEIYCKAQHKDGTWGEEEIRPEDRSLQSYGGFKVCGPSELPDEAFHDTMTADMAVERLKRDYDKPWFLAVGFTKPHLSWIVPKKYFELYDPNELVLPEVLENDIADTPDAAQFASYQVHDLGIKTEEGGARRLLHAYLATITYMDAQLGRVLEALDERSDAGNTVIMLWSDHGWHLGEKQCWSKFTLWDESTRNPLMVSAPGLREKQACTKPAQLVDMYPTLVELCGLPMPGSQLDGRSLVPLMKNPQTDWEWPSITCNGRDSYALTFEHWKYNRFFDGSEELYDLKNDPLCHVNLADKPEQAVRKKGFSNYLPTKSHPNVSDGKEWMLWLEDYPRMNEWRAEMDEIHKELARTGRVNNQIFRRKCRAAIEAERSSMEPKKHKAEAKTNASEPNAWFKKLDADGDGRVTWNEFLERNRAEAEKKQRTFDEKKARNKFDRLDADNDGNVSWPEMETQK
ncbi:sulfatase [Pontiella sulfatireligans]|uniref:Choline-sulfatase n=1 Tax=Pontiella sulfatireligans TaxID=2750658 RepID=A0A6C2URH1_9BACT|nr:sulfatase [Pontiella sulfatireligans]SPS74466.1 sulfatase S1_7 [Kiritimatiellales bacterium]VGO21884.1 Choline-sulfatase [Pontiella sulfatireligans]